MPHDDPFLFHSGHGQRALELHLRAEDASSVLDAQIRRVKEVQRNLLAGITPGHAEPDRLRAHDTGSALLGRLLDTQHAAHLANRRSEEAGLFFSRAAAHALVGGSAPEDSAPELGPIQDQLSAVERQVAQRHAETTTWTRDAIAACGHTALAEYWNVCEGLLPHADDVEVRSALRDADSALPTWHTQIQGHINHGRINEAADLLNARGPDLQARLLETLESVATELNETWGRDASIGV